MGNLQNKQQQMQQMMNMNLPGGFNVNSMANPMSAQGITGMPNLPNMHGMAAGLNNPFGGNNPMNVKSNSSNPMNM